MNDPVVAAIVCVDSQFGIGLKGKLPWRNQIDMDFFRTMTRDSACIMGRATYDGIDHYRKDKSGPLLKNRSSIVVSTTLKGGQMYAYIGDNSHVFRIAGDTFVVDSIESAYAFARDYLVKNDNEKLLSRFDESVDTYKNIFFIGGAAIYKQCAPYINKIYLNVITDEYHCDTFFPKEILQGFEITEQRRLARNLIGYEYDKKNK